MSLADLIEQYKPLIDQEIEQELARRLSEVKEISPEIGKVVSVMQELSVGGKRLRGLLTILGYQISTQSAGRSDQAEQQIIKAAMVMELFHLGLLIQDDVMDRGIKRRGVKTIHARYADLHLGESLATLAGDLPLGWGMENLAKLNLSKEVVAQAILVWGKYTGRVIYGQMMDVSRVADEATLLSILNLKSGEYTCVLPLLLGATLRGGSEELKRALTEYGMELGWVFQLRDDWLGEFGDSSKTGKPVGNDSREGKKTLATMYGRERLEEEINKHWEEGKKSIKSLNHYTIGPLSNVLEELLEWVATREN